ncbi:arylsulfatase [Flavobacteriales bacterium]|nr:arylsulfatase [Flavobacteriales bacterium]
MSKIAKTFLIILLGVIIGCNNHVIDKPNVIYILADDLGYGELGIYGQKIIETPNIDALAKKGLLFTDHYTGSPVCAPARSVLMTGQHSGHTYIRNNGEWSERGDVWSFEAMFNDPTLEGQRPLPDSTVTVAKVFKDNGYKTGMVGKWGLGAPHTSSIPNLMGFDFFYGYNCQRQAHTFYPTHLWKNTEKDILNNYVVTKQEGLDPGADINSEESYIKYNQADYSATLMHNEALNFIEENKDSNFFLYYASPIPHLPLQAPKEWVDYYRNKIGSEKPYIGRRYYPNQYPKATYAAMISYLDEQVGEIVEKLKEIGKYENTLIIFTSDNGPTHVDHVDIDYFNSAGILNGDRIRVKGRVFEGGIRVPMIAHWPSQIKSERTTNHISAFQDFYATALDILKLDKPDYIDGLSYLPLLTNKNQKKHDYLYWEFSTQSGQQAVRYGKWKGLKTDLQKGPQPLQLFNLEDDIKEIKNVSDDNPMIVEKIESIMQVARTTPALETFKIKAIDN